VLMCLPATNKGWEWDIDFLHAVVGPGLSKNVTKPTMQCSGWWSPRDFD